MAVAQKQELCPQCRQKVKVSPNQNPNQCPGCGSQFNVVVRTVRVRFEPSGEVSKEELNKIIDTYSQVGQWFLDQFRKRLDRWTFLPKGEHSCFHCGQTKNSWFLETGGQTYCSPCAQAYIMGAYTKPVKEVARRITNDLKTAATDQFQVARKGLVNKAFEQAQSMFKAYLNQKKTTYTASGEELELTNWGRFIRVSQIKAQLQAKKQACPDAPLEGEDPLLAYIRRAWKHTKTPMCITRFFELFYNNRQINDPKKRREKIKALGTINEVAYRVLRPVCGDGRCQHLENVDGVWRCALEWALKHERPSRVPRFPTTMAKLKGGSYRIHRETLELPTWQPHQRGEVKLHGRDWLISQYGHPDLPNTAQPYIWRRPDKPDEYYLMLPKTDVAELELVPIQPGNWEHVVAYGLKRTCVLSVNGQTVKVKFFKHGRVLTLKDYFSAQRGQAGKVKKRGLLREDEENPGYPAYRAAIMSLAGQGELNLKRPPAQRHFPRWLARQPESLQERLRQRASELISRQKAAHPEGKKGDGFKQVPRNKERRRIKDQLHNEAAEIATYLAKMPGRVTVLNMHKKAYGQKAHNRKQLNKLSRRWVDSVFRPLLTYKAELAGLVVEERQFKLSGLAVCPYCGSEAGGSWQDLVLIQRIFQPKCSCGREFHYLLGIAWQIMRKIQENNNRKTIKGRKFL